ncbi:zinc-binding dehydrogenase [Novosphingobium fuchskuhlense]|uniref:Zinc-binding dehydrogenase n=1 Tax=Novosphingobium fuchskuhlense TaxID=1117702 RepID=A0A124JWU9_9SPHN|nr:NAD(P)-dependent alcohol dehydrogenase [Novosphingobium fuchskuhlense]KUR73717.1 zinc-binding dehydrogenase [Novosphingobium fuchskuhlense]
MNVKAYAAHAADQPLGPFVIERREPGPKDVVIAIAFCGVCHSDLHTVRGEWGGTLFPCVPGHEIVGTVSAVGSAVTRFAAGDTVGVGCIVDSCRTCAACGDGLEQFCASGMTGTYNSPSPDAPGHTLGGYAQTIVVDEAYVLSIRHKPEQLAAVAPLLCAGITTWSPLRHWQAGPGKRVGVVGIGGLGHMGIKLARALGAEVTGFTTNPAKRQAILDLGAHHVVVSTDKAAMKAARESLDLIINTVSHSHDLDPFLLTLTRDGTMVMVGGPEKPHPMPTLFHLLTRRRSIAGSLIGGIAETQEMLDFCAENGVVSDIELIRMDEIEAAYARMVKSDVRYRFVIDTKTI